MAITYKDRVKDTSTSTGTGDFTLAGSPPTGYQSFNTGIGVGPQFAYCIFAGSEWEVGLTVLSGSTTLVRGGSQKVLASSNSGSAVSFSSGTKTVICTAAAGMLDQTAHVASDVVYNNTTTFTNLSDLTVNVLAGGIYRIQAIIPVSMSTGGMPKFDWDGGTATATSFEGVSRNTANTTGAVISALSTSVTGGNLTGTSIVTFDIIFRVNAGGTLIPRAAQNSAAASDTTIKTGASLIIQRLA